VVSCLYALTPNKEGGPWFRGAGEVFCLAKWMRTGTPHGGTDVLFRPEHSIGICLTVIWTDWKGYWISLPMTLEVTETAFKGLLPLSAPSQGRAWPTYLDTQVGSAG
jgi:hypothetical protein